MTEKVKHDKEAFFRTLYENSFDAVLLADSDGAIISANPSACRLLAMSEDEIKRRGLSGIIVGYRPENKTRSIDEREINKLSFKRHDGTTFIGETISSRFSEVNGRGMECLIIREDPVNRQARKIFTDREHKRFYQILSSMPYGILLVTNEDRVEFVNQAFCDMFGLSDLPSKLVDLTAREMIDKVKQAYADPEAAVKRVSEIVGHAQPVSGEGLRMTRDRTMLRDFIPIRLGENIFGRLWIHVDITDIKRAHRAMEESRSRLSTILDTLPVGVVIVDANGKMVDINPAGRKIWGIDVPLIDSVDRYIEYKGWHLENGQRYQAEEWPLVRALKNGETIFGESIEIENFDGKRATMLNSAAPIRDNYGQIIGALVTVQDLTELKRAEAALNKSEMSLAESQRIAHMGSWEWNIQTGELLWSAELYSIYGLDPKTTVPNMASFANFIHPDDREFVNGHIQKIISQGSSVTFDFRIIAADGSIHYLNTIGVISEWDENGKPLLMVGTNQDITERKKAESALRESEEKYRGLFANMKETVTLRKFVYDDHGEVVDQILIDANARALEAFGVRSLDEVKGKRYSEMNSPEQLNAANRRIKRLKATGVPVSREVHMESNDRYYLRTSALLGTDHVIATGVDITETKRAQKETEIYAKNLRRSNEELQQFAYVASHDLQEPLRMVLSYLSLLQKKYRNNIDGEAQKYIDFAMEGGTRMRHLIDDLLEYSRVETKGKDFVPVNMNDLVRNTLAMMKDSVEKNKANVVVEALPTVFADESQMIQVMQNLISNAIKFRGKERPEIRISATNEWGEWKFAVKDNGIGLDMAHAERIFQMFQRLHTKEAYPGSGVGLAIAKKIMERHGGRIWVESEEGKGATFFFTLPIRQE